MTGLFERAAPRGPGRVYSPRRMLGDLRRLLVRLERAYGRTTTDEARRWCRRVADDLERHILAGEAVLPGFADPRPGQTRTQATGFSLVQIPGSGPPSHKGFQKASISARHPATHSNGGFMRARYSLGVLLFLVGLVVAAALLPTSVSAQLAANEVYALQTFSIAWTHDGVNTNVYRYFRNNVQVGADIPVASRVNGEVVVQHTGGLAVGSYTLRLDAIGDGGTGRSADFVLVVKALPTAPVAPTLPRIIRVTP